MGVLVYPDSAIVSFISLCTVYTLHMSLKPIPTLDEYPRRACVLPFKYRPFFLSPEAAVDFGSFRLLAVG